MSGNSGGTRKVTASDSNFGQVLPENQIFFTNNSCNKTIRKVRIGKSQPGQDKDVNKQSKTPAAKNSKLITPTVDDKSDIPGQVENVNVTKSEQHPQNAASHDYNSLFTPQKSVPRSPPPSAAPENAKKSHIQKEHKKSCDGSRAQLFTDNTLKSDGFSDFPSNTIYETKTKTNDQNHVNMDNLLLEITTSLEAIQKLSNQENRETILNSTFHIQKSLTLLIYKMGQLEQEKINLEHIIQIKNFNHYQKKKVTQL